MNGITGLYVRHGKTLNGKPIYQRQNPTARGSDLLLYYVLKQGGSKNKGAWIVATCTSSYSSSGGLNKGCGSPVNSFNYKPEWKDSSSGAAAYVESTAQYPEDINQSWKAGPNSINKYR